MATNVLVWFSAISFFGYGISCIATQHMRLEFARYRLAPFRVVTGVLQILGATGLIVGLLDPRVGLVAAVGLTAQMALGVWTRIRIGDSLLLASPALSFMGVNAFLSWAFAARIGLA